jgi:hypothetical protein
MARTYHAPYPVPVTREQAQELAGKLRAEQPERHFVVRESVDGGFEVASVVVPEALQRIPGPPGGV